MFFYNVSHAQDEYVYELFGEGIGFTEGFNVIVPQDNGYLLIGSKGYQNLSNAQNPWVIKLNQECEYQWEAELDFASEGYWNFAIDATEVEDGYIVLGNFHNPDDFGFYSSLMKLDFNGGFGGLADDCNTPQKSNHRLSYKNITFGDAKGQKVFSKEFKQNYFSIERGDLPNGVYYYTMFSPSGNWLGSGQLVFQ